MNALGASPVKRGCGTRKAGGIYAELGLTVDGVQLESFYIDPPLPLSSVEGLEAQVSPVGVLALERDGVTHVVDWIGASHYPNAADFLEEVRRFGLSRRIPSTFPLEKLTPESRILVVHPRAVPLEEWDIGSLCPYTYHVGKDRCIGALWETLIGGEVVEELEGSVVRKMPSFEYTGSERHAEVEMTPGVFASFPISRLVVVEDLQDDSHREKAIRADHSGLPVDVVPE